MLLFVSRCVLYSPPESGKLATDTSGPILSQAPLLKRKRCPAPKLQIRKLRKGLSFAQPTFRSGWDKTGLA